MNKLKTFFQTFSKSLTSPKYYKDILKAKFSFSLKYLLFLLFLVNLLLAVKIAASSFVMLPKVKPFISEAKTVVASLYPEKLVLTIKKQKITTNVKEPYVIEFPEQIQKWGVTDVYKHLLTIDTKGKVDDYQKYSSVALLTSDSLVVPNEETKGSYKIVPLTEQLAKAPEGQKIDRKLWDEGMKIVLPYFDKVPGWLTIAIVVFVVLLPFLGAAFSLAWKMLCLLFVALILWLLAKILKKKLGYGDVYRLSMHGLTLPILVGLVLSLLGIAIPILSSIILFVWMVVVIAKIKV